MRPLRVFNDADASAASLIKSSVVGEGLHLFLVFLGFWKLCNVYELLGIFLCGHLFC